MKSKCWKFPHCNVKFYTQDFGWRTEWYILPAIGIIDGEHVISIAFAFLKWSLSVVFRKRRRAEP